MSLTLIVLTPENSTSREQAVAISSEQTAGMPDSSGALDAYAKEVYDAYSDDDWPFADDPRVDAGGFVVLTVASDAWEAEVPSLATRAHKRGLTVLDPQVGTLFRPAEPWADERP
jgi:hypothetical protein